MPAVKSQVGPLRKVKEITRTWQAKGTPMGWARLSCGHEKVVNINEPRVQCPACTSQKSGPPPVVGSGKSIEQILKRLAIVEARCTRLETRSNGARAVKATPTTAKSTPTTAKSTPTTAKRKLRGKRKVVRRTPLQIPPEPTPVAVAPAAPVAAPVEAPPA